MAKTQNNNQEMQELLQIVHFLKDNMVSKEDLRLALQGTAAKDDLKNFATKDDLKNFATKDDLKNFATKDDLKNFATKDDLHAMEDRMLTHIDGLATRLTKIDHESMATKFRIDLIEERLEKLELNFKLAS